MIRIPENLSTKFSISVNSYRFSLQERYRKIRSNPACWLCKGRFHSDSYQEFCPACRDDLPFIVSKCEYCALPMPCFSAIDSTGNSLHAIACGECISQMPSFSYTTCSYLYDFPIQQLLHRIKYQKQRYWITPLAEQLAYDIRKSNCYADNPYPDLLVPVPLHANNRKKRGFNQAALIARHLSLRLHIPMKQHLLIKTTETSTQVNLNKMARIKNLQDAFQVTDKYKNNSPLTGKHIALVDDVMTTKATADVASKCLLQAGASRVDIWCLARTPKFRNEDSAEHYLNSVHT